MGEGGAGGYLFCLANHYTGLQVLGCVAEPLNISLAKGHFRAQNLPFSSSLFFLFSVYRNSTIFYQSVPEVYAENVLSPTLGEKKISGSQFFFHI